MKTLKIPSKQHFNFLTPNFPFWKEMYFQVEALIPTLNYDEFRRVQSCKPKLALVS